MLLLSGDVIGVESKSGVYEGQPWGFTSVSVFDGSQVIPVRLAKDYAGPVPTKGEELTFEVRVFAETNRRGPYVKYTASRALGAAPSH